MAAEGTSWDFEKIKDNAAKSWDKELSKIEVTSTDKNGQIMSMKHAHFDIRGVQYHPESVLTPYGKKILENWLLN